MSAARRREGRSRPRGTWHRRALLGQAEGSVRGRRGAPASGPGRAAHATAAGTRTLSSLRQENKQKAGWLLVGTTGRFPWEKLPCSSPRWPRAALHRGRPVGQGRPKVGVTGRVWGGGRGAPSNPLTPTATPFLPKHVGFTAQPFNCHDLQMAAVGAHSEST